MKSNYLFDLNQRKRISKFNTIFQSIVNQCHIFPELQCQDIYFKNQSVNLILEQINKPQYIICQSGDSVLLQQAIFWDEQHLISEGILQTVFNKVKQIVQKIKQGIKEVLQKSSDVIKAFCQKVVNNKLVAAIIKKLGLKQKVSSQKFKKFIKIKNANGEVVQQSSFKIKDGIIITEATKLSKAQQAMSEEDILKQIKRYENNISGKKILKNKKTDKALTKKYCKEKIRLLKKLLEKTPNESSENTTQHSQSTTDNNTEESGKSKSSSSSNTSKSSKKIQGYIYVDSKGIENLTVDVKNEATNNETKISEINSQASVTIGGKDAEKAINNTTQKKGIFSKIKDAKDKAVSKVVQKTGLGKLGNFTSKIASKVKKVADETGVTAAINKANQKANQLGNKAKQKILQSADKLKEWYGKQNKWIKILIWLIIGILSCLAIHLLITSFIMPIIYGIMHGGVVNGAVGLFRIYVSGKVFVNTFKAGQKAWQSGQGWGKFFLLLIGSVFAALNLKQMADAGAAMMAKDQIKNATVDSLKNNPFDLNHDGKLSQREFFKMVKQKDIPGIDLSDQRYLSSNGWQNFQHDLSANEQFRSMFKSDEHMQSFFDTMETNMQHTALNNLGVSHHNFSGNSWFQTAVGIDPSIAQAEGEQVRRAMMGY